MRTRHKLLVTLLAGVLGVCAAEGALRVLRIRRLLPPTEAGDLTRASPDPDLREELVPGATQRRTFWSRHGEVSREIEARVNAQGFRGPVVEVPKPDGVFRIACLGDSQTFGDGVGEGRAWPAVLEGALRAARPDGEIEVINAGVGGYDTEQEIALLEKRVAPFEPDLVVLGFFVNDTALPGTLDHQAQSLVSKAVRFFAPGRPGAYASLRERSQLVDLGSDWLLRRLTQRVWLAQRGPVFAPEFDGWVRVQAAIRRGRELCEARGARFLVLLVPLLMSADGELASSAPYRTVSAFCRAAGIAFCDPERLFAGLDVDRLRVHERDLHTGDEANRILGEGFARWLIEQDMIPLAPPR